MRPYSGVVGPVPGEYGPIEQFERGPLIVTQIQADRVLHVFAGPPWESASPCVAVLSPASLGGGFLVTAKQCLAVPEGFEDSVHVAGFHLEPGDADQLDPDPEGEATWGKYRRDV